jgi:hypothetical protein
VFRDKDMATRGSALRRQRQPLFWWLAGALLFWPALSLAVAGALPRGPVRGVLAFAALAPLMGLFALVVVGAVITKKNDGQDG